MLTIRLARIGKKKQPTYRLIINERTKDTFGDFLEILGNYNPRSKETNLKTDRIKYWLSKGAGTSNTVHNLLVKNKVIDDKAVKAWKPKKKKEGKKEDGTSPDGTPPIASAKDGARKAQGEDEKPRSDDTKEKPKDKPEIKPEEKKETKKHAETEKTDVPENKKEEPQK